MFMITIKSLSSCDTDPKLVYDKSINQQDNPNTVMNCVSSVVLLPPSAATSPVASHLNYLIVVSKQNIYDPLKEFGFLAHSDLEFTFIGPGRHPTPLDNIDTYIRAARVIKETGLPNYRTARFPIQYDLKMEAWCQYLTDYFNKRLID